MKKEKDIIIESESQSSSDEIIKGTLNFQEIVGSFNQPQKPQSTAEIKNRITAPQVKSDSEEMRQDGQNQARSRSTSELSQQIQDNLSQRSSSCSIQRRLSEDQGPYNSVFQRKSLKESPKFNNALKHLIRSYVDNFGKAEDCFLEQDEEFKKETTKFIKKQKKNYQKNPRNYNNNLSALRKIFGLNNFFTRPVHTSLLMRKNFHQIARKYTIPHLHENKQIKGNKLLYMLVLKVQRLRCRNAELMCRTQIK